MIRKLLDYFNLEGEVEDFDKIHAGIEKDVIFRGTNLWILVFAIVVASVGLNVNSTAVIIGAMLISPLMGPINGMGYSVATYNFPLFRKAFKNFAFAVVASLVASTLYFTISPVSTAHSELLARTSPTIYDVLIALFGGLAGILAISCKQKGNVLPGVAIATALMPPLCTAGYGLATGQYTFFLGAFYLFTINTVFIAISSVVISQILKFPIRTIVDGKQKSKVNKLISLIIVLTIVPSIYFGYGLVQNEKFSAKALSFTNNISVYEGSYLLKNEVNPNKKQITLVYGGTLLNEKQKEKIAEIANDFGLENPSIIIKQGFSLNDNKGDLNEVGNLKAEINRVNLVLKEKEHAYDSIKKVNLLGKKLLAEIHPLYPELNSCSYSQTVIFQQDTLPAKKTDIVVFNSKTKVSPVNQQKINNWLKSRLNSTEVKTYFE